MSLQRWVLPTSLAAALLIGMVLFADALRWLADSWLTNPNYSHGILVPFIAAYFFWRARTAFHTGTRVEVSPTSTPPRGRLEDARRREVSSLAHGGAGYLRHPARRGDNRGLALLAGALLLHLAAIPLRIYPLSIVALVVALMSMVVLLWGLPALRASGYAYAVLLLMIPIPLIDQISPSLEAFTARVAAGSVSLLGTQAVTMGSQVQLPTVAFEIGAACSGLRSLASLVTLAVVFSGIAEGPAWGKGLILLAAAPLAIGANLVRVASILQFAQLFGVDAGLAYYHDYSSPVLFLLAFSLLILFGRAVRCSEIRFA